MTVETVEIVEVVEVVEVVEDADKVQVVANGQAMDKPIESQWMVMEPINDSTCV